MRIQAWFPSKSHSKAGGGRISPLGVSKTAPFINFSVAVVFRREKSSLSTSQQKKKKKKVVKYIDFEVVGKYHYPFTDGSLAFIMCDRETVCGNACKDTFPMESRRSTCSVLTGHASYLSHKLAGWVLLSPALGSHGACPPLVFLLSGAPQCWPKVYCTGLWMVIQPWLSPFKSKLLLLLAFIHLKGWDPWSSYIFCIPQTLTA